MAGNRQVQLIGGENYPYFFTSSVIAPNPEGLYPFYISAILVENETIRHELYRCRRTIMCLNAKRCPWQVRFLRTWMHEYFLPSIRTIEESREQYLATRYRDLKVNVPSTPPQYISQLAQVMDDLEFCLKNFSLLFTDQDGHVLDDQIETKMVELQRHFDLLETLLLNRYDEMELFWPVVIKEHGPKEWQEVLEVMMTGNYAIKGEAMATFTAATLNSMGLSMDNNLREALLNHILSSTITSPAHAQYIERGETGDIERGDVRENSEVLPFDVTLFSTNTTTTAVMTDDHTEYSNRNALNTGSNRSDVPNPASPTEATMVPTVTATTIITAEPTSQRFAVDERGRFQFGTRPWCSLATQEEYFHHYPFAFSEFLLRTWDERYLRFQLLLFSICLDRDLNEALDVWKDKESWCLCRIS